MRLRQLATNHADANVCNSPNRAAARPLPLWPPRWPCGSRAYIGHNTAAAFNAARTTSCAMQQHPIWTGSRLFTLKTISAFWQAPLAALMQPSAQRASKDSLYRVQQPQSYSIFKTVCKSQRRPVHRHASMASAVPHKLDATPASTWRLWQAVRHRPPLVMCITNFVSMVRHSASLILPQQIMFHPRLCMHVHCHCLQCYLRLAHVRCCANLPVA